MEALGLQLSGALSRGGRVINTHSFITFDRGRVGIQERVPAAACRDSREAEQKYLCTFYRFYGSSPKLNSHMTSAEFHHSAYTAVAFPPRRVEAPSSCNQSQAKQGGRLTKKTSSSHTRHVLVLPALRDAEK